MKKIVAFLLCAILLFSAVYPAVSATSVESGKEYFDDGSYITVTYVRPLNEINPPADDNSDSYWEDTDQAIESASSVLMRIIRWLKDILEKLFAKEKTITKTKYCNYFDKEGKLLWSASLKATFTYNHRKAVCVSGDISYEITDPDWKMLSFGSKEEGNTASGYFSIRQYKLGVPLKLIEKTLTLKCDRDGNVK